MKKPTLFLLVLAVAAALVLAGCGSQGSSAEPSDRDTDGVIDSLDGFPDDSSEWADSDDDGIGDNADPDDDNDHVADILDPFPNDPDEWSDSDGDGAGDNLEATVREAASAILLGSLADVPVPEPENLDEFLNVGGAARNAAIALGKALFWDMQVGSDGQQACGSCHFHAGADSRTRNQLSPNFPFSNRPAVFDATASGRAGGPNYELVRADFPLHKLADPKRENFDDRMVLFDSDDVVSSQGVFRNQFNGVSSGQWFDLGTPFADPLFNWSGANTRRVAPRNAPTTINAVFNFTNFWDGRAHPNFNGETVIGPLDDQAGVWVEVNGVLTKTAVSISNASLASQAVGPPLSPDEMSYAGRTFPDIGRKLLGLQPLGQQIVHPGDSVLRDLIDPDDGKGLSVTYGELIQTAFQPRYWNSAQPVTLPAGEFTQMEANFALFFGLAIQMYEATLVSDRAPFDRFMEGDDRGLRPLELEGLKIFMNFGDPTQLPGGQFADLFAGVNQGFCVNCHDGAEFTSHSVTVAGALPVEIEIVPQLVNGLLVPTAPFVLTYQDEGMYNIGIRPTAEDLGRGGSANGIPLSFTRQAIAGLGLPFAALPTVNPDLPGQFPENNRATSQGAFKVPGLRNVELTGPFMHNGGMATLTEVLDFYHRKGDFSDRNLADLNGVLSLVQLKKSDYPALIAFLLTLTDERVRYERAPFDHPQLFIPAGDGLQGVPQPPLLAATRETFIELPAVGAGGRLTPLKRFLDLDPFKE